MNCYCRKMWFKIVVAVAFFRQFNTDEEVTNDSRNDSKSNSIETTTKDDIKQLQENLRDIGYYLRSHKFNEYDRRYETDPVKAERLYYKTFPKPPLRSLHWEVHQYCDPSFRECVDYLAKKLRYTSFRRADDTSVMMIEQKWTWRKNQQQIEIVDAECLKNKRLDDTLSDPFAGPLERYQWKVTASYYMCWYTLLKTPEMKRFYEKCDNFANCLDYDYGSRNDDERVEDWRPFSCALYSFCPDICCPFRHLARMRDCLDSADNPCFRLNKPRKRSCEMKMSENTNFNDIILNRWNVSCECPQEGYEWNSRYGICIDVDECASKTHNCHRESESCLNLQGSFRVDRSVKTNIYYSGYVPRPTMKYTLNGVGISARYNQPFRCICRWGYLREKKTKQCLPSNALAAIKLNVKEKRVHHVMQYTFWQKIKLLLRKNAGFSIHNPMESVPLFLFLQFILTLY